MTEDLPESQQRLVDDLREAGAPDRLVRAAKNLRYHDYESDLAMPKTDLMQETAIHDLPRIRRGILEGRYDP